MYDPEKIRSQLEELQRKISKKFVGVEGEQFGDHALRMLGIDIADSLNGIHSALEKSFSSFYSKIGCHISGDKNVDFDILSHELCGDLYELFKTIDLPAHINLVFFLTNPRINGLKELQEKVTIYLQNGQFEVRYEYGNNQELNYPKQYSQNLLRIELPSLIGAILSNIINKMEAST